MMLRHSLALLAALTIGATAHARSPASDKVQLAKKYFEEGENHYRQQEFQQALAAYKKALATKRYPAFLYNIAQCYRQLRSYQSAIFYYKLFLSEQPNSLNRAAVLHLIGSLSQKLEEERKSTRWGKLSVVTTPAGAQVLVDRFTGSPVANTPAMLRLSVGAHLIRIQKPGFATLHRTVTIREGEITLIELELKSGRRRPAVGPIKPRRRIAGQIAKPGTERTSPFWKRWWFWTGVGLTVALAATGGGLAAEALSRRDKWNTSWNEADRDAGIRARTGADVCAGLATALGVGVVIGAIVVGRGKVIERQRSTTVLPGCGARGCGVWVTGRF